MTGDITNLEGDGHSLAPGIGTFTISVSKTALSITEGASDSVSVVLNAPQATDTVVSISLTSQTGVNRFNPIPASVTIPAGQLSKTVLLSTIDDVFTQAQETWIFAISSTALGASVSPDQTIITLLDNDGGAGGGTSLSGPVLLKQFNRQPASGLSEVVLSDGRVLFSGTEAAHGTELWVSDGTTLGTNLLKDIYPGSGSGNPNSFYLDKTSGIVYFLATTPAEGEELWRTDGTAAGTYLILDSAPGLSSQNYLYMASQMNGKAFFYLEDSFSRYHVYVSDGTAVGTFELAPAALGNIYRLGQFITWNSKMYFSIVSSTRGKVEFWSTDGTTAGTQIEFLVGTGNPLWAPANFYIFGSKLFFAAQLDSFGDGPELYSSNGTTAGTGMVKNINTHSMCCGWEDGSYPYVVGEANGVMILQVTDGTGVPGTWVSDGTTAGTVKLATGTAIGTLLGTLPNGKVVFSGGISGDPEPWVSDGTLAGTFQLRDIVPGTSAGSTPTKAVVIGSRVLFTAYDGGTAGIELWSTDGTLAGTYMVKDIYPGSFGSTISAIIAVGNKAVFGANDGTSGQELWVTDGTPSGTSRLSDINPGTGSSGPNNFIAVDSSRFFFTAYNPGAQFGTLFYSDLSTNYLVGFNNAMVTSYSSGAGKFAPVGAGVAFSASNNGPGNMLWYSDGTDAGTTKLIDIYPAIACNDLSVLGTNSGSVFFTGSTGTALTGELWSSNGTVAGSGFFAELNPGSTGATPGRFYNLANGLSVFAATTTAAGAEPWVTDGTVAGTHIIQDLVAGSTGSMSSSTLSETQQLVYIQGSSKLWVTAGTVGTTQLLTNFGGTTVSNIRFYNAGSLMFMIINTSGTPQLWRSDGTIAGTYNVTPSGGTMDIPAQAFATPNGKIYFVFNHTTLHLQIVVNDGTIGGSTALVTSGWTSVGFKTAINNTLFFTAAGGSYMTDGTLAGTSLVPVGVKVEAGGVMLGGKYYYRGDYYGPTNEIWVSDGTVAGTSLIKAICNGTVANGPANFTVFNGKVYFTADDCGVHGNELWVTDGTATGTQLLEDINPGVADSNPTNLTVVNGKLYMTATKVLSGTQVWVMAP